MASHQRDLNNYEKVVQLSKDLGTKTQQGRILSYMLNNGWEIEVWRLITPRTKEGLGCAQYNARIKELRGMLQPLGFNIVNKHGEKFVLQEDLLLL